VALGKLLGSGPQGSLTLLLIHFVRFRQDDPEVSIASPGELVEERDIFRMDRFDSADIHEKEDFANLGAFQITAHEEFPMLTDLATSSAIAIPGQIRKYKLSVPFF